MPSDRVIVIGAGIGGLVAALELAARGAEVTVIERAKTPGGKMREIEIDGRRIDAGPTVLTMRWVFEDIFEAAGASLADYVALKPLDILGRHAWDDEARLDLFADIDRSADAIGDFAGAAEARRYRDFCAEARHIYETLEEPFLRSEKPGPFSLARRVGFSRLGDLWRIRPFATMWAALGTYFQDPRLRQLFGRYATYCGSSPFRAPATLMLIAHVEQEGVWSVEGGMHRLAAALADLATAKGACLRFGEEADEILVEGGRAAGVRLASGERLEADAIIANADAAALGRGNFGDAARRAVAPTPASARSLSAVTWAMVAEARGFPLVRHNVFFSGDYAAEFDDIFRRGRVPAEPTVYVCAQDRGDEISPHPDDPERLFCLVNAPANRGDPSSNPTEIEACEERTFRRLARLGLHLTTQPETRVITGPSAFGRLFPATGGALYGRASHGWMASFRRAGARTRLPGLYLAGGSAHPGPGVPMAALSGRLASARALADFASTRPSRRAAMLGGMSTRSATTGAKASPSSR